MDRARRRLTAVLIASSLGDALAQEKPRARRVGVLLNGAADSQFAVNALDILRKSFASLGYEEGRGVLLEPRYADLQLERLPALAAELAAANVDILLALGGPAARAAQQATATIPVVFSIVTDPVALGLVKSMDKPGAHVTGITNLDRGQAAAQMQLLREVQPDTSIVAVLSDAAIPGADDAGLAPIDRANVSAAQALGMRASVLKLKGPTPDLDASFAALKAQGAQALIVLEVPITLAHRQRIATLAASHRLPSVFPGGTADAGGLLTFGTTVQDTWPRMASIADRIFKGTSPSDLPVEVVTRRELVVNLKTANEIGVTVPQAVRQRADRRIE